MILIAKQIVYWLIGSTLSENHKYINTSKYHVYLIYIWLYFLFNISFLKKEILKYTHHYLQNTVHYMYNTLVTLTLDLPDISGNESEW